MLSPARVGVAGCTPRHFDLDRSDACRQQRAREGTGLGPHTDAQKSATFGAGRLQRRSLHLEPVTDAPLPTELTEEGTPVKVRVCAPDCERQIMFRRTVLVMVAAVAATSGPALAMEAMRPIGEVLASGRVVKVDTDVAQITIEHRPILRFYMMESMTRIFKVRDVTMLTGLTPGDRIRFKVERAEGGFAITWIENANE